MSSIKIEIGQYRAMNKGFLKGFFTLCIYPEGQKILDCQHFEKEGRQWISFPQKKIEKEGKTDYIPIVSYLNKEYLAQLNAAILEALKEHNASNTPQNASTAVQGKPSDLWF